jgi:O-antigen ligase
MNINRTLAQRLQLRIFEYGSFITVLLVVSIYFSTSLSIIVSALMGLFWLLYAQFMTLPVILKKNPVAVWSFILFLCFILASSYGSAPFGETFAIVMKYRELSFIPVLNPFLTAERYRV